MLNLLTFAVVLAAVACPFVMPLMWGQREQSLTLGNLLAPRLSPARTRGFFCARWAQPTCSPLAEVQEPAGSCGEAGGGRGLGEMKFVPEIGTS